MDFPIDAEWMIVNVDGASFCRVWVVGEWFRLAVQAVARGVLGGVERLTYEMDQLVLYKRGFVSREEIEYMCSTLRFPMPM
jgi:hypothetical protein